MLTASARAAALNVVTLAWIAEDPSNRWATLLVEDAAHWAEYDIETGEQLDAYLSWCNYVDAFKAAHGIKPRWTDWRSAPATEWDRQTNALYEQMVAEEQAEARMEASHAAVVAQITDPTPLTHNPFAGLRLDR